MANSSNSTPPWPFSLLELPFSGDVWQDYHPFVTWLEKASTQLGFVNINGMRSDDPDLEKSIIGEVGSYGKQLGRTIEALQAICEYLGVETLDRDQKSAVRSFLRLAEEIDEFKSRNQHPTERSVDRLVAELRALKAQDRTVCERIQKQKTFTGISKRGSLEEALQGAIAAALESAAGTDPQVTWTMKKVSGRRGGTMQLNELTVEIEAEII